MSQQPRMSAPVFKLPQSHSASIEFPANLFGEASVHRALAAVGGLDTVSSAIATPSLTNVIQLAFGSQEHIFRHPVQADLLEDNPGVFSIQCSGLSSKTLRFRKLADFQFSPDMEDPILRLASAIREMNVEQISKFELQPVEQAENYAKGLNILPPPSFAGQNTVPFIYNFKQNTHAHLQTVVRSSGEEVTRLQAKSKYAAYVPHTITFDAKDDLQVPQKPLPEHLQVCNAPAVSANLVEKLHSLMEDRPMWTHQALTSHLTDEESRTILNYKELRSVMAYSFSNGPFRELHIRYGYDPRKEPDARIYQRIALRNVDGTKNRMERQPWKDAQDARKNKKAHIFDGETLNSPIANYQLVDVLDPIIVSIINAPEYINDKCDIQTGWYRREGHECIHQAIRRKFIGLCNGVRVPDTDLADLLPRQTDGEDYDDGEDDKNGKPRRKLGGARKIWQKDNRKRSTAKRKSETEVAQAERLKRAMTSKQQTSGTGM